MSKKVMVSNDAKETKRRGGKVPKFIIKFPDLISKRKHTILKAVARNDKINIQQLSRKLKISYKETYKNVSQLTKVGLLKRKKFDNISGHPVILSLPDIKEEQEKVSKIVLDFSSVSKLLNPNKTKIIKLLSVKKEMNQLEITKALRTSYKEGRRHIDDLTRAGVLKKRKQKKTRGTPVWVSLTNSTFGKKPKNTSNDKSKSKAIKNSLHEVPH